MIEHCQRRCRPTQSPLAPHRASNFAPVAALVVALAACERTTFEPPAPSLGIGGSGSQEFLVTTWNDAVDANPGDGVCATRARKCSLRAAVQEANTDAFHDVIILKHNTYVLWLPEPADFGIEGGDLNVTTSLDIRAPKDSARIESGGPHPVFSIYGDDKSTIDVSISNVVICCGTGRSPGLVTYYQAGGITLRDANVTVAESTIEYNWGPKAKGGAFGVGGVYVGSEAFFTLSYSTVRNNSSAGTSGGVGSDNGGTVFVENSTIYGNDCTLAGSFGGGGVGTYGPSDLAIHNSTISGNSCGGVFIDGDTELNNVTISDNRPIGLTGFMSGELNIYNSIIALNVEQDCSSANLYLDGSTHHVLVGNPDGCGFLVGETTVFVEPDAGLDPLGDYGGATLTHRLQSGSPAIDAGSASVYTDQGGLAWGCFSKDQRDRNRYQYCDVGSYERTVP